MLKKPLFVANWKMNIKRSADERRLGESIASGTRKLGKSTGSIVICPTFLGVSAVDVKNIAPVMLGAQDCFWKDEGAYTGEVSAKMLVAEGCKMVLLGHSERRRYLGETDQMVADKLSCVVALKGALTPIICVGETLQERKNGETLAVIGHQLRVAFNRLQLSPRQEIIVAYEPVWAIGSGKAVSADDCSLVYNEIRSLLALWYPVSVQRGRVAVIYGGSVTKYNVGDFVKEGVADGVLVGGASLKSSEFLSLIKAC